ncbi:mitochondrial antiviral-signaling protein isoform X2 [Gadus chalcogrammus]|nr:mitochondrial antiviral-signaling protein isoform X2 [Gadus chalcogrammus]XP_056446818.1 mitochondrial antiviral-signaling protein isoform X2 [Gadus chalcogrammus]XP_056446819.1 mitochondrial antiviral-signaling protein isoform X2 [Gadus chalcogrammus]
MSFVSDQLYNGYIRTHMSEIVSKVKVREIIPHLPCLTLSDREEVEAKREHNGNFNAMQLLLQSLHRRENWPEQFIAALVACEHRSMAAEIVAEYRRLKTPRRESPPPRRESPPPRRESPPPSYESPPPSPPKASTVVMATVHSPPAVSPSDPTGASSSSSSSLPEPPEAPWAQTAPLPKAGAPDPRGPSTPPTPVSPPATLPARQEPEENSEEPREWVGAAVGSGFTAVDGAGREVPAQTGSPAPTGSTAPTGSPTQPESMVTWRSGEESGDDDSSGVGDGSFASGDDSSACGDDSSEEDLESASSTLTPEKLPVQESAPPQVQSSVPLATAPPVAGLNRPDPRGPHPDDHPGRLRDEDEDDVCLSKPGALLSVRPDADRHAAAATLPTAALSAPPFSGNDISLQISDPAPEGSGSPPRGDPSVCGSLASFAEGEAQEVLEHVGHVTEEPSVQNLASPAAAAAAQGILGNAVRAPRDPCWDERNEGQREAAAPSRSSSSSPGWGSGGREHQVLNGKPSPAVAHEQAPSRQPPAGGSLPPVPEKEVSVVVVSSRTKYAVTVAGVAACAMLVAWRLKH